MPNSKSMSMETLHEKMQSCISSLGLALQQSTKLFSGGVERGYGGALSTVDDHAMPRLIDAILDYENPGDWNDSFFVEEIEVSEEICWELLSGTDDDQKFLEEELKLKRQSKESLKEQWLALADEEDKVLQILKQRLAERYPGYFFMSTRSGNASHFSFMKYKKVYKKRDSKKLSDAGLQKLVHEIFKKQEDPKYRNPEYTAEVLLELLSRVDMERYYQDVKLIKQASPPSKRPSSSEEEEEREEREREEREEEREREEREKRERKEREKREKKKSESANELITRLKTAILIERDFNIKQKMSWGKRVKYYGTLYWDLIHDPVTPLSEIITVNGRRFLLGVMPTNLDLIEQQKIKRIVGVVQASEYPLFSKLGRFLRGLMSRGIIHNQIETEDFTIESDEEKISKVIKEIVAETTNKKVKKNGEYEEEAVLVHCKLGKVRSTSVLVPLVALLVDKDFNFIQNCSNSNQEEEKFKKNKKELKEKYKDFLSRLSPDCYQEARHLINVLALVRTKRKQSKLRPEKFEKVLHRYMKIKAELQPAPNPALVEKRRDSQQGTPNSTSRPTPEDTPPSSKSPVVSRALPPTSTITCDNLGNEIPQLLAFKALKTYGIKHEDKEINAFMRFAAGAIAKGEGKNSNEVCGSLVDELKKNITHHGFSKKGQLFVALREELSKKWLLQNRQETQSDESDSAEEVGNNNTKKELSVNVNVNDMIVNLNKYKSVYGESSVWHSRQAHVDNILSSLNYIRNKHDLIALLYTHYAAIQSISSQLSRILEKALCNLLFNNNKNKPPIPFMRLGNKENDSIFKTITQGIAEDEILFKVVFTKRNAELAYQLMDLDKLETGMKMCSSFDAAVKEGYQSIWFDKQNNNKQQKEEKKPTFYDYRVLGSRQAKK
ncbi:MAG: hypothetical protein KIT56_06735 [Gammaproteobacteria bacterium]|nr:hypothetical protein [Gammaproteobacteria bacterium]MCW5583562.1 hypothetical protein [Gammaproteobacteria bacterium]